MYEGDAYEVVRVRIALQREGGGGCEVEGFAFRFAAFEDELSGL